MDSITNRYVSPAQPPRLLSRTQKHGASRPAHPVINLHTDLRQPPALVSFAWGRVAPSSRFR